MSSGGHARRFMLSGLALFGSVADGLQLESVRIEPAGRKAVFPVLGELAWLVQDDGSACTRPLVCLPDDRSALDQECEVMQACLAA